MIKWLTFALGCAFLMWFYVWFRMDQARPWLSILTFLIGCLVFARALLLRRRKNLDREIEVGKSRIKIDFTRGFQITSPNIFIPWLADVAEQERALFGTPFKKVKAGYYTLECEALPGLHCVLGLHSHETGRLTELEFFRRSYEDLQASFTDFQSHFESVFGAPTSSSKGAEGFSNYEWCVPGARIVHYVFERFGPEEHLRIQRVAEMNKSKIKTALQEALENPGTFKSGEYLEKHVLSTVQHALNSGDRKGVIDALQEWIALHKEPQTLLAAKIAAKERLSELTPDIQKLRTDIDVKGIFPVFYVKWIDDALSVLLDDTPRENQPPVDVVAKICALPVQLKARDNASVAQLIEESGYLSAPEALSVATISAHLRNRQDLIDAWLMYSSDKRTSAGWYISEKPDGGFEIGNYPNGKRIVVSDRIVACAEFIVREVCSIVRSTAI